MSDPTTPTIKLQLAAERRRVKRLLKLLERALDAMPDYIDGRNDTLAAAIERELERG